MLTSWREFATNKQTLYKAFHKKNFSTYNAGNVLIHPFEQELKIIITSVFGSTDYFELRNLTNNTVFRINEAVGNRQTIMLDGPNITSNDLQYLRNTNKQFIEISPGWNEFEINGANSATVEFIHPFYYK